jgi:peptidoglycan hydrolase-like protein with peptidoglycan-binding domain
MLKSAILAGNARLDGAASGGPSVKKAPPADEPEAVRRIQKALAALGFSMPRSFPSGPANEPDGKFGDETFQSVISFQRREFPQEPGQWDGRCGKNTLGRMDELLSEDSAAVTLTLSQVATSRCRRS